jgi:hypothetical protein
VDHQKLNDVQHKILAGLATTGLLPPAFLLELDGFGERWYGRETGHNQLCTWAAFAVTFANQFDS